MRQNLDPSIERKQAKIKSFNAATYNFEAVTKEWLEKQKPRWTPKHTIKIERAFKRYIFPELGTRPIADITAPELLKVMRQMESRGIHETTMKILQTCGVIFRYGIVTGRCERNPAADLKGALTRPQSKPQAALNQDELPEFLRILNNYTGHVFTKSGLIRKNFRDKRSTMV